MKNIVKTITSASILLCITYSISSAQTYIQGDQVLPIQQIVTSSFLNNTNRLTIGDARSKINDRHTDRVYYANSSEFAGEAYLTNNMVVEIVSRLKNSTAFSSLEETKERYWEMLTNTIGEDDLAPKYHDEIKNVNNYKVLVHYYKFDNVKDFIVIDNQNKYVVMGSIHCYPQDIAAAEAFVDTLLNSITFK